MQLVPKFNRPTPDHVTIFLALFRVEGKGSDVVLSVNIPTASQNPEVTVSDEPEFEAVHKAFRRAAETLKIVDFGLFVSAN